MREDIELLAGHFYDEHQFDPLFLSLVPWNELSGEPNAGHAAICDLLLSGAVNSILSSNFDMMIESWAWGRKVALRGALDGAEAASFARESNPLVKFHGCANRSREKTFWTPKQLNDATINARISGLSEWMKLNLKGRDLLIIGFSSDWDYLNSILVEALVDTATATVTMIDTLTPEALSAKAPALWKALSGLPHFEFVRASSEVALEELSMQFSKTWMRKLITLGKHLYEAERGPCPDQLEEIPKINATALYDLRRDLEGKAPDHAARLREPSPSMAQAGYSHLILAAKANARIGSWYKVGDVSVRVVQGSGEAIATVESRFREPPAAPRADYVICAGATRLGVPGSLLEKGKGSNIMRPGPGGTSKWLTLDEAKELLEL